MMFTKTKNVRLIRVIERTCSIRAVELFNGKNDLHNCRECMGKLYISAYISAINDSNQTTFFSLNTNHI